MSLDGFAKQASVTLPLQTPGTIGRAAAPPQQRYEKTRGARRIGKQSPGILRARAPTRDSGAGRPGWHPLLRSIDANAQQKKRDAGGLRRPRQTQGRGEIKRARGAGNFDQGGAQTLAPRGVDGRTQDGLGVASAHQRQGGGIGAEFRQPQTAQAPGLALQKILPRPKQRPPRRRAQSQSQTETNRRRPIGVARRLHFMQARALQSAAEKNIHVRRAQGEEAGSLRMIFVAMPAFDPGKSRTQGGQGFSARRRSVPPRIDPMHGSHPCSYVRSLF